MNRISYKSLGLTGLFLSAAAIMAGIGSKEQILPEYRWDLSDMYTDWQAWEDDRQYLRALADSINLLYPRNANELAVRFYRSHLILDRTRVISQHLFRYAQCRFDTDTQNPENVKRLQEIQTDFQTFNERTGWLNRAIQRLKPDTLASWTKRIPDMARYGFYFERLYRSRAMLLTSDEEKLLSDFDLFMQTPEAVFRALSESDHQPPWILSGDGNPVLLTRSMLACILQTEPDRSVRETAWQAYHGPLQSHRSTYAQVYQAVCLRDWARAQARGFESSLESFLDLDNVPPGVFEQLIESARNHTETLRRYHRLRKIWLRRKNYTLTDSRLTLAAGYDTISYTRAGKEITASAVIFGEDIQARMRSLFTKRWIDVYPHPHKRSGAYSFMLYGEHPYFLLNYEDALQDAIILAHESGHAMHNMLAAENQEFNKSQPSALISEIPSTFWEQILLIHMNKTTKDTTEKIVLLENRVERLLDNFFGAAMEAEFEWRAHRLVEQGESLSAPVLDDLMTGLYDDYFGDILEMDDLTPLHWMRMPHFYTHPFYLYHYAASLSVTVFLISEIEKASDPERSRIIEKFLSLLKAGGSDDPMNLLKIVGIDMMDRSIYDQVPTYIDRLIDRLEKLQDFKP